MVKSHKRWLTHFLPVLVVITSARVVRLLEDFGKEADDRVVGAIAPSAQEWSEVGHAAQVVRQSARPLNRECCGVVAEIDE